MYNGSFTCLTMSKEVLESVYLLSLLNQNDKNWFPIVFIISKIPIVINTDFRLLFLSGTIKI
jgi:hypothetical protein